MSTSATTLSRDESLTGHSPWEFVGPNWFACVMGTGILPIALLGLPVKVPGAEFVAAGLWLLAACLLVTVVTATVLHHLAHPTVARSHAADPVRIQFYGAPPMALMTVGAGALVAGRPMLGEAAVVIDAVLWTLGTVLGLVAFVAVPRRMVRHLRPAPDRAFGGWLMPVVPPMVSAATGALLLAELPEGAGRQVMFWFCVACMALAAAASAVVFGFLLVSLVRNGPGLPAMVPTWWIVLGPLGQSVTALHHLAARAPEVGLVVPGERVANLGLMILGAAGLWGSWALVLTWCTRSTGLPFSLTWWSFTFPVGTVVTGVSGMAELTGSGVLATLAAIGFGCLVAAWAVVFGRTVRGVRDGSLLRNPSLVTSK